MNAQEALLNYPLDTAAGETLPAPGGTFQITPGVKWIRMALPFALNHINLWLLRDELDDKEGWTVVDCCIDRPESRQQWEQIFANELEGLPILRVIVTHMHPDHIGLAHWLCEKWTTPDHTCRLWISATDFNAARMACQVAAGHGGEAAAAFVQSHGISNPEFLSMIRERTGYYADLVPRVPSQYVRLMDGMSIKIGDQDWHCIAGYGHAPEHIALHCPASSLLISGDMILPRISTNVSVYDLEPEANPLKLFLDSIAKMKALPDNTLILPSHGKPFLGLHERIKQLEEHHAERLVEVIEACKKAPQTAHDIVAIMFKRQLDLHQLTFAQGEALAHLHKLWFDGALKRERRDGVYRFSAA
ncbi:MBL fold metallo-hydrolase [Variovorax sp. PCZ-1]|uniref:MBL fold metallo-hydrolase n=1 Tax=Variovorax sp. PCZ-1 TaxID=2835533 RepID=UPI001BD1175A|nr:MBL fold metallo-hydrolase [Variovorax sp. PCZ-1]MBS7807244.1 MBL fold metallo-hydrolase [Variovorax sp. PCZ-1]